MVKTRGYALTAIFLLFFSGLNIYFFVNKGRVSYSNISGNFIQEIPRLPLNINISIIAFVGQWIILLIVAILAYLKFIKAKKEEHVNITYNRIKNKKTRSETDLDILYNLLLEKKKLSLGLISRTFHVKKDTALEWGKILENNNLARIEYPTFNEPEIRLLEKEKVIEYKKEENNEKQKKTVVEETSKKTFKKSQEDRKKKKSKEKSNKKRKK